LNRCDQTQNAMIEEIEDSQHNAHSRMGMPRCTPPTMYAVVSVIDSSHWGGQRVERLEQRVADPLPEGHFGQHPG